jgi:hypothetical protein
MNDADQGLYLIELEPPPGSLSREAAVSIVRRQFDQDSTFPILGMRFGLMQPELPGERGTVDHASLLWDNPVWVVILGDRWIPRGFKPHVRDATPPRLPMHYVIDSVTGEYLFAFHS